MYQDILKFWFDDIDQSLWWSKDDKFDQVIKERFSDIHTKATRPIWRYILSFTPSPII